MEEGEVEVVKEGTAVAAAGELGGGAAGGAGATAAEKRAAVAADAVAGQVDLLFLLREVIGGGVDEGLAAQGVQQVGVGLAVSFAVGEHRRKSGVRVVTGAL